MLAKAKLHRNKEMEGLQAQQRKVTEEGLLWSTLVTEGSCKCCYESGVHFFNKMIQIKEIEE